MNKVILNHAVPGQHYHPARHLMLLVSLLVCGVCVAHYLQYQQETNALIQQRDELVNAVTISTSPPKLNEKEKAEVVAVNVAIATILRPWPRLFSALEMADSQDIQLLSVEPNVTSKSVRIRAVTLSVDKLTSYIDALKQQDVISSVSLNSTQAVRVAGHAATEFDLLVRW